ncbi:hypothetical protein ACWGRK_00820 [Saccharomonospora azurea]
MTFDEVLPAIIVVGYGIAIALGARGSTLRKRAVEDAAQLPSASTQPAPPWGTEPQHGAPWPGHGGVGPAPQHPQGTVHHGAVTPVPGTPPGEYAGPVPPHAAHRPAGPTDPRWDRQPPPGAPVPAPPQPAMPDHGPQTSGQTFEPATDMAVSSSELALDPRHKLGGRLLALAWLLGIAVTVLWIQASIGLWGLLTILLVLVVLPSVVALTASAIARARGEGRKASAPARILGALFAGCLFVVSAGMLINGLSFQLNFAQHVDVHITGTKDGVFHKSGPPGQRRTRYDPNTHVHGHFVVDGEERSFRERRWYGELPPEPGDVVGGRVAPLWPRPLVFDDESAAGLFEFLVAGGALAGGGVVLYFSLRRPRKQIDDASPPTAAPFTGGPANPSSVNTVT